MTPPTFEDQPVAELARFDLQKVFSVLWLGKFLLMFAMLVGGVLGGLYAWKVLEPEFHATAIIEFSSNEGGALDISSFVKSSSLDTSALNTQIANLRTHEVAVKLAQRLELTKDPEFNPLLRDPTWVQIAKSYILNDLLGSPKSEMSPEETEQLALRLTASVVSSRLAISAPRDARLISIVARSNDPKMAAEIANSLAEIYIEQRNARQLAAAQDALTWLTQQVRDLQEDLVEEESNLKDLVATSENITEERLVVLGAQAAEFEKLLFARRSDLEGAARNIAVATENQDEAKLDAARLAFDQIEAGVHSLAAAYANIKQRLTEQSGVLQKIGDSERKIAVIDNLYKTLLAGLQETTVYAGRARADTFMMSSARPALQPSTPNVLSYAVLASTLAGAILGFLLIWRASTRQTVKSVQELNRLFDLPVFGETLAVKTRKRWDVVEYLKSKPTSAFSETLRNLRTSVFLAEEKPPQVIMLTSSVPGEGKTSISILLATSIGQLGKKVLVIEGDVRKGTFLEFSIEPDSQGGLASVVLSDKKLTEAVQYNDVVGADVLVGGHVTHSAADLFASKKFEQLVQDAREIYDHIIIDTPPVTLVTDARIIARFVDQILFVVRWDHTLVPHIKDALNSMTSKMRPVNGLVLSQVNPKRQKRYGYGGSYGKYSGKYYSNTN